MLSRSERVGIGMSYFTFGYVLADFTVTILTSVFS